MTKASNSTAKVRPTAKSFMNAMPLVTNPKNTMLMRSAAAVMMRPLDCSPPATAASLVAPASRRSFMRETRKTS